MRSGEQGALARRYRKLLLSYPADYRAERGEELLDTLLEDARPGQSYPEPRDAADLVRHGLHRRLREDATPGLAAGLRVAAPIALALATGLAAFLWLTAELAPAAAGAGRFGPFATVGPIAYTVWLLAAIGNAFAPRAVRHDLTIAAVATTALLFPAATVLGAPRPPLWVVASLMLFGMVALAGPGADAPTQVRRGTLLATAIVAAVPVAVVHLGLPTRLGTSFYYDVGLRTSGVLAGATLAALAATGVCASITRSSSRHWWWALVALLLPALWLLNVDLPWTGRLAQFLLAACVAGTALGWWAARGATSPVPRGIVGAIALACAGGLGAALWLTTHFSPGAPWASQTTMLGSLACVAWAVTATAWILAPAAVIRVLTASALAVTLAAWGELPEYVAGVLAALGATALLDVVPSRRQIRPGVPIGALLTFLVALAVGVYDHNWQLGTWTDLLGSPTLTANLALPALAAATVAGCHGLRYHRGREALRHTAVVTVSATGIVLLVAPSPVALMFPPIAATAHAVYQRLGNPPQVSPVDEGVRG